MKSNMPTQALLLIVLAAFPLLSAADTCVGSTKGEKQLFWGDLHVHSGYSLDAWGYGTAVTPARAYEFAKGASVELPDGSEVSLLRPLDFMAVTDHAEWFNLMYVCTDPLASDDAYCDILTEKNSPATGTEVFSNYVLPTITKAAPQPTPLCQQQPDLCKSSHLSQWQRVQQQANAANEPCKFTSFVAFEWSATPDFSHNHRNVIFANDAVTADAIDYMRYPTPKLLWRELDKQCRAEDGCDVLAIPHNTNMGDGKSFDIETESADELALRAKYEQLVEIHQEKGNSECLPGFGSTDEECNFERYLTKNSRPATADGYSEAEWERMRGGYVRRLLLRGLYGYQQSGERRLNPLQLGIIGSTDNHAGTGGFVDEESWPGSVFGLGDFERTMSRRHTNPGGLVAVWAQQNTRESIFAALKRREVYATSGPRMRIRVTASPTQANCDAARPKHSVSMGGTFASSKGMHFLVEAQADQSPLASVEIIKGQLKNGELQEQVVQIWHDKAGGSDLCVAWQDAQFEPKVPAFWYARVRQTPTPRWTAYHCMREGRCDDFPAADRWIQERAWTSPVWYLPENSQ
ncbi:MAG: DUF3604 domain-containing protein [Pseudomonadales bacterium]